MKKAIQLPFLLLLLVLGFSSNAQVNAYTVDQLAAPTNGTNGYFVGTSFVSNYSSQVAFATGSIIDDSTASLTFNSLTNGTGFVFRYNTVDYSGLTVSTNGHVYFGTATGTGTAASEYSPITTTALNYSGGAISIYGRDMDLITTGSTGAAPNVYYAITGTAPNRILKMQWVARRSNGTSISTPGAVPTNELNMIMQLWLYETTGVIEMYYFNTNLNSTGVASQMFGQIGLRGTAVTDFQMLNYQSYTAPWPTLPSTMGVTTTNTNASVYTSGNSTSTATIQPTSNRLFRWTPAACSAPSTGFIISNITHNGATFSWNAPAAAPSNGYEYYIGTSPTPSVTGSTAAGVTTTGQVALSQGTTYYYAVRSVCSSGTSSWSAVGNFTTYCAVNVPYYIGFDGAGVASGAPDNDNVTIPATSPWYGGFPVCTRTQNAGSGNPWVTSDETRYTTINMDFQGNFLMYNGSNPGNTNPANTWFFTKGINLTAGTSYRLSYLYSGTDTPSTVLNKMRIYYGTTPAVASMTNMVDDQPSIKGGPSTSIVNFVPATSGVYYFGLNCYSGANNGQLAVDDISFDLSICLKPTSVSVANITSSSALLSWTAPSPAPAQGYAYYVMPATYTDSGTSVTAGSFVVGNYYRINAVGTTNFMAIGSPSNAVGTIFQATGAGTGTGTAQFMNEVLPSAPTNSTVATGTVSSSATSVTLNGLSGNTKYYFWVRTSCGGGDFGEWVALNNSGSGFFTTIYQPTYCQPGVSATPNTTTYITNVTTTNGVANLNNSSGYTTGSYANYSSQIVSQAPGFTANISVNFIATGGVGISIFVDWNNNGIFDLPGERVYTSASYLSVTPVNTTITVPGGQSLGDYRMRVVADWLATTPDPCNYGGTTSRWEVEDYTFRVVTPPPPLSLNIYSDTQCAGSPSSLIQITSNIADFGSYTWSPNTVSGTPATGYTITNTVTTTYTLTATQTSAPFGSRQVTFVYYANQLPTPITVTPATPSVCQSGPAVALTATGGLVSGFPVVNENFNTGAPGWTTSTTAAHTGGNTAASLWTIRNSGYNPGGTSGITNVTSNDSSQFYISNSDAQGSGSTTFVELTSPVFSLSGYNDASLQFYHYYKPWINGTATVFITTNGGSTWTQLQQWGNSSTTSAQGTATNFALVTIPLTAYIGQTSIQVKFSYTSSWGYVWAIDNFLVSATASSAVRWNLTSGAVANGVAVPGLYTSAAATPATQYLAGTGAATVYALPTATTNYTASASTPSPVCSTNTDFTVTVIPFTAGTASADQTICSGSPANLTLVGNSGSVTKWQYATDFAFTTPVDIASSASNTLTSAQMGTLSATRYYRAVVVSGTCSGFSNVITITVDSTTWNGLGWSNLAPTITKSAIFAGNYSSTGDLEACSVIVQSGTVVFNTGHTLKSQNAVTVSGGSLTFEDDASLVQVANVVNSGNITYKRITPPIRKFDYVYWSSPVAPQTLFALSPNTQFDKYYTFDPVIGGWSSISSSSLMTAAKGYIVRGPNTFDTVVATPYAASFVGVPNNGTISIPIVLGTSDINLIGNPYPSAVDIDLFMDYNGNTGLGLVDKTIYLWTHNTAMTNNNYTNNDYAVYNYMGGVGTSPAPSGGSTPTGKIGSGQSFFIKGLAAGSAIFNNTMRVMGNNTQFYRSAADKSRIWLQISDGAAGYKQTLVGYAADATNAIDSGFDGEMIEAVNTISIYSIVDTHKLTIQGRALPFSDSDVVPLGYKATTSGNLTIGLYNFDGLFSSQSIYLKDKALNIIHDLKASDYVFATVAGTFDNRFELIYTNSALGINDGTVFEQSVLVYNQNGTIKVVSSNETIDRVEVYDIRGVKLASLTHINGKQAELPHVSQSQQVLLVKVISDSGVSLTRKIQY